MGSSWLTRLLIVVLFVSLASSALLISWAVTMAAFAIALVWLLYETHCMPRFMMDILDRLSNKQTIEEGYKKESDEMELIDSAELSEFLKSKVVGQDLVADEVAQYLRQRIALQRRDKPLAVFCFAGPPGVGKTYFAKVLAEKLFGHEKYLQFFDMSQYSEPHAAASMFGQARGYVGSDSYGTLTAALQSQPRSIVLLDEFEKAHGDVHKRFLTAWNDGFVTEASDGAKVSTSQAIFILTTNAAAKEIGQLSKRYSDDRDQLLRSTKEALRNEGFAPEVLSRIDRVFSFAPLSGLDVARVVALEIERLVESYGLQVADGGIDPEILIRAIDRNQALGGNVRDLARMVEHDISEGIIEAKAAGATEIRLADEAGRVVVRFSVLKENAEV